MPRAGGRGAARDARKRRRRGEQAAHRDSGRKPRTLALTADEDNCSTCCGRAKRHFTAGHGATLAPSTMTRQQASRRWRSAPAASRGRTGVGGRAARRHAELAAVLSRIRSSEGWSARRARAASVMDDRGRRRIPSTRRASRPARRRLHVRTASSAAMPRAQAPLRWRRAAFTRHTAPARRASAGRTCLRRAAVDHCRRLSEAVSAWTTLRSVPPRHQARALSVRRMRCCLVAVAGVGVWRAAPARARSASESQPARQAPVAGAAPLAPDRKRRLRRWRPSHRYRTSSCRRTRTSRFAKAQAFSINSPTRPARCPTSTGDSVNRSPMRAARRRGPTPDYAAGGPLTVTVGDGAAADQRHVEHDRCRRQPSAGRQAAWRQHGQRNQGEHQDVQRHRLGRTAIGSRMRGRGRQTGQAAIRLRVGHRQPSHRLGVSDGRSTPVQLDWRLQVADRASRSRRRWAASPTNRSSSREAPKAGQSRVPGCRSPGR